MSQELDESFWVDFVEGELEPSLREDMELLLSHSESHRDIVYGIENVRAAVKSVDGVEPPQDGNYYLERHDRIMAEIAKVGIEPPRRRRKLSFAKLPQYLMMLGILALAVAVLSSIFLRETRPEHNLAKERIQETQVLKAALPEIEEEGSELKKKDDPNQ